MRSKKKKRTWLKVTGILLLVFLVGAGVYGYTVYKLLTNAVDTMHEPVERKQTEKRTEPVELEKKDPFSVLMLGIDQFEGDSGRSDTIIVLTVNPNTNSIKMLSIPRDTRTAIIGKGIDDKINHAYAFGGVPMSMDTVENFLDIPIDYYVQMNMAGFKDIVDAVGGVTVNNDRAFTSAGIRFEEGELTLDGQSALTYSRMRKGDPKGDFGRQLRQQQIIKGIIKEGASITGLANLSDIFNALGENVKTNLTLDQMIDIQQNYKNVGKDFQQLQMVSQGTKFDGIYYGIISDEEKQRVQNELKTHLELN